MNAVVTIGNVSGYLDSEGTAWLNLENVARGLGFTRVATSGNEVVRWGTVRKYLGEFGVVPTSWHGKNHRDELPDFIPENIFYKLCFKASNATARKFQDLVTDEILPAIRKTGGYAHGNETDFIIKSITQAMTQHLPAIISETVKATLGAVSATDDIKMAGNLKQGGQAGQAGQIEQTDTGRKVTKRRVYSKIDLLPKEVRDELLQMLFTQRYTYLDISHEMTQRGHPISKSSIGRYFAKVYDDAESIGRIEIEY